MHGSFCLSFLHDVTIVTRKCELVGACALAAAFSFFLRCKYSAFAAVPAEAVCCCCVRVRVYVGAGVHAGEVC